MRKILRHKQRSKNGGKKCDANANIHLQFFLQLNFKQNLIAKKNPRQDGARIFLFCAKDSCIFVIARESFFLSKACGKPDNSSS